MKLKNNQETLLDKLKKSSTAHNTTVKDFNPVPKKSPEVMALDSISWQLKRIADLLESKQ